MSIKIDKIYSELSKGNFEEQYEAYLLVKDFVQKSLSAKQKEVEEKANELQNKIDRLSGTNY